MFTLVSIVDGFCSIYDHTNSAFINNVASGGWAYEKDESAIGDKLVLCELDKLCRDARLLMFGSGKKNFMSVNILMEYKHDNPCRSMAVFDQTSDLNRSKARTVFLGKDCLISVPNLRLLDFEPARTEEEVRECLRLKADMEEVYSDSYIRATY